MYSNLFLLLYHVQRSKIKHLRKVARFQLKVARFQSYTILTIPHEFTILLSQNLTIPHSSDAFSPSRLPASPGQGRNCQIPSIGPRNCHASLKIGLATELSNNSEHKKGAADNCHSCCFIFLIQQWYIQSYNLVNTTYPFPHHSMHEFHP